MKKLSKMLIVDDDQATSSLHKILLQKFGISHKIETATDGEKAIQLLKYGIQSNNIEKIS